MRRFTPSVQTNALFNSSITIFQANRNIRTRFRKQKESKFFDFEKDFPNLNKLYNHVNVFSDKYPFFMASVTGCSIAIGTLILLNILSIPYNISSISYSLEFIQERLTNCSYDIEGSERKLGKLTNEFEKLNQTIASFKK